MNKKVYEIDGNNFSTLEEFCDEFNRKMNLEISWNGNLNALNDILNGGFGTPDEGFVLTWKNSAQSRVRLGYGETIRQIEKMLQTCHPSNVPYVKKELDDAKRHERPTGFGWLVEIICGEGHEDIGLRLELFVDSQHPTRRTSSPRPAARRPENRARAGRRDRRHRREARRA